MRRWLRRLAYVALALAVLVAGLALYVGWTVRRSFPELSGRIEVAGLTASVDVWRDDHGIPTIFADTPEDLFFAQGFVHAQDRFWEMDFRRHVTAGRLSEWFGADQLETDSIIRTMGWRRVAEQELPLLDPQTRTNLEAYADGVNAYLAEHSGAELSFEHWLLGVTGPDYVPYEWTPVDSLAWLKAMAWDLRGNMQVELQRARLQAMLPRQRVEQLYPVYPYERHSPIVESFTMPDDDVNSVESLSATPILLQPPTGQDPVGESAAQDPLRGSAPALASAESRLEALTGVLGPAGSGIGSNSWVLAGSRTESGRPILANDPHLAPSLPSVWYQMNLRCREISASCPYDVGGFTFSGFPGVIIGHTSQIAWGFTNLGPDVTDLYVERLRGDDVDTVDGWTPLDVREETIEVAGDDPVTIEIRASRHGPLISDPSPEYLADADDLTGLPPLSEDREYAVALRWTALDPGRTADAVFAINTATSWPQFRAAAELFEVPAQNLVYADVEGNIGYQAPGRIPVRSAGDGRTPVPGWTGEFEWTRFIPFDSLPYELNPESGFVVAANQAVAGPDYPYELSTDWSYGYRSQRLIELIESGGTFTPAETAALQVDAYNANAAFLVPRLPEVDLVPFHAEARALLDGWDFQQPADSAPAAYFNAFWRKLLERTFQDELPETDWPDGGERWFEVVRQLWDDPADPWWDDVTTPVVETRDHQIRGALTQARDELTNRLAKDPARWEWGRIHTLELEHSTFGQSGIGLVESIFNRGPLRVGGGGAVVQATAWDAADGYAITWAPSMRMVVDLGDLDDSSWINLTGQSGHPYDRTYVDQADLWRDGGQLDWPWSTETVDTAVRDRLVLAPS